MSGSDAIVIATILFLLLSAVVLVLMLYTMKHSSREIQTATILATHTPISNTAPLGDIQDFIKAKAEILYNGNAYAINTDCYKIGRSPECNLIISDYFVSRIHCEIVYHDNMFILSNLAYNGTYVNGELARSGNALELHDRDEIRIAIAGDETEVEYYNGHKIRIGFAVMEFRRCNSRKTNDSGMETPS